MNTLRNCFGVQRTVIALLSLAAPSVCLAGPPEPGDDVKEIRDRGDNAADAGNLTEAIGAWRDVWKRAPNDWELANNIGRGELRLGNYREAARWLTRCLNLYPKATNPKDLDRHKAIVVELMTARQQISTLMVDLNEPETRLVVDDDSVWVTPIREDLYVEPGEHRLQAFKGIRTAFTTISTVAGKEYRVALALPPSLPLADPYPFAPYVPPPPPAPPESFRWWPVAVGGGFVVTGVLLGGVFAGVSGLSSDDAARELAAIESDGKNCIQAPLDPRCASYDRYEARSTSYSTAAIVSLATAGAITAGVIGYAIYENHRVSVSASPTTVAMRYQW